MACFSRRRAERGVRQDRRLAPGTGRGWITGPIPEGGQHPVLERWHDHGRPELATRLAHTLARVVTTAELRKKLLLTLGLIVLFRFGANLPLPGISEQDVQYCAGQAKTSSSPVAGVFAMLNVLSGNALLHLAVFALGIMPYITASIIVQLLTQVVPRPEKLKQQGQAGQAPEAYSRAVLVNVCREGWRHRKRHPEVAGKLSDVGPLAEVVRRVDPS